MSLRKLNRPSSLLISEVANVHLIGSFEVAFETGSVLCRTALWDCFGGANFDPVSYATSYSPMKELSQNSPIR